MTAEVAVLTARLRELDDQTRGLRARVEEAERQAARQAAPFRRDPTQRVQTPNPAGQPVGHRGVRRPVPSVIDADIEVPLAACPHCAGPVTRVRPLVQYIEDLPPVRPHVTRLTTFRGHCRRCARAVASTHPWQVSTATGAAGVQLGPRAIALAATVHHHLGVPLRGTCRVLAALGGLRVSPGGLTQIFARLAARLAPAHAAVAAQIRAAPVVHSDETSWWVGGASAWLWVFTTPTGTLFRIAETRARAVVTETLGAYDGVLVSDCLSIYDAGPSRPQKCYAHHLRAVRTAYPAGTNAYADQWTALLRRVLEVQRTGTPVSPTERRVLEQAAEAYLATPRTDPLEEALRRRFAKQRDPLFTCLDVPNVPATNNLAERQLRPAVIRRKLSCGNRSPAGARTWEVLTSLAATCAQRGESFLTLAANHVCLALAR